MITDTMNGWLVDHFGYDWSTDTYSFLLQDFSDEEVSETIEKNNVKDWYELRDVLIQSSDNEEVIAHLYGDKSAEARQESIRKIKELQERML